VSEGVDLGGTTSDNHNLTVVGDETVDGYEVGANRHRSLSVGAGTDTGRAGG